MSQTAEDRCDCCDLPVSSCGRAVEQRRRDEAKAERARLLGVRYVIEAQYGGRCVRCDEPIAVGDPIAPQDFDRLGAATGWVGPCCIDLNERLR